MIKGVYDKELKFIILPSLLFKKTLQQDYEKNAYWHIPWYI